MAGRQGLEPRYAAPEAAVLPLDDLPVRPNLNITQAWRGVTKGREVREVRGSPWFQRFRTLRFRHRFTGSLPFLDSRRGISKARLSRMSRSDLMGRIHIVLLPG